MQYCIDSSEDNALTGAVMHRGALEWIPGVMNGLQVLIQLALLSHPVYCFAAQSLR
jgi:hypothetical protein